MYKDFSAVKDEGYEFEIKKPYGIYSFVALDGCPETGAGRPFNFFGYLDTRDMDLLANTLTKSIIERHNHTFGMSHYPTGTTLFGKTKDGIGFWDLTQHVSVWFCGHLHQLAGGLGETMYAFQENKVLELELGDMKMHGLFRIIAVDNDLVSFIDLPIHQEKYPGLPLPTNLTFSQPSTRPPIVLITNPKDARYIIPGKEPVSLIQTSTHIRVLVWASSKIVSVEGFIDGVPLSAKAEYHGRGKAWKSIESKEEEAYVPLWTIDWTPLDHQGEDCELRVIARDSEGRIGSQTVRFRVDGTRDTKMDAGTGGFIMTVPLGLLVS